jgi:hypothetical protein
MSKKIYLIEALSLACSVKSQKSSKLEKFKALALGFLKPQSIQTD